jgi:PAS domain-containing protein
MLTSALGVLDMEAAERQIQDRLGAVLKKLATLENRASSAGDSRVTQSLLTDFRRLVADLERAFVSLREASLRYSSLQREVEIASRRAGLLLELSPLPYVLIHANGVIIETNRAAAKALNVSERHLRGKAFDIFLQGDRDIFLTRVQHMREDSETERWPVTLRPRERYPRPIVVVAACEAPGRIALILAPSDVELSAETGAAEDRGGELESAG